ncbi:DUF1338 domain-containing protein [Thaumasiovibrio sp. DFM-14]|uniref:DUF1338 domain-containing protein n=1 Tax=Thaumasiovibrio sp. DFM-14 TaxID=3384792 RepID=UPI0039A22BEC
MYQRMFELLWQDYVERLCPSAQKVHHLLSEGEPLRNDHIALRTFNLPEVGLDVIAAPFIAMGYVHSGEYHFEQKKLYAAHFEHPDPQAPKVFISELLVGQCSCELQQAVRALVGQLKAPLPLHSEVLQLGRPWSLPLDTYQLLAAESEYAAWVAAHGYGANHFTVSVNQLSTFGDLAALNYYLMENGFVINSAGGEIKGSEKVMLEQSATMADKVLVTFDDGELMIPGGFYEFAKRYPDGRGNLYHGFVTASADKIFESTYSVTS